MSKPSLYKNHKILPQAATGTYTLDARVEIDDQFFDTTIGAEYVCIVAGPPNVFAPTAIGGGGGENLQQTYDIGGAILTSDAMGSINIQYNPAAIVPVPLIVMDNTVLDTAAIQITTDATVPAISMVAGAGQTTMTHEAIASSGNFSIDSANGNIDLDANGAFGNILMATDGAVGVDVNVLGVGSEFNVDVSSGDVVLTASDLVDINAGGILDVDATGEIQLTSTSVLRGVGDSVNLSNTGATNSLVLGPTNVTMNSGGTLTTTSVGASAMVGSTAEVRNATSSSRILLGAAASDSYITLGGNLTHGVGGTETHSIASNYNLNVTRAYALSATHATLGNITLNSQSELGMTLSATNATASPIGITATNGAITLAANGATNGNLIVDTAGSTGMDIDVGGTGAFDLETIAGNIALTAGGVGTATIETTNANATIHAAGAASALTMTGDSVTTVQSSDQTNIRAYGTAGSVEIFTTNGAININAQGANGNLMIDTAGSAGMDIDVGGTGLFSLNTTNGPIDLTTGGATNDITLDSAAYMDLHAVGGIELISSSVGDIDLVTTSGHINIDANGTTTGNVQIDAAGPSGIRLYATHATTGDVILNATDDITISANDNVSISSVVNGDISIDTNNGNLSSTINGTTLIYTIGAATIRSSTSTTLDGTGTVVIDPGSLAIVTLDDSTNQCDYASDLRIQSGSTINARFNARGDYFPELRKVAYDPMVVNYNADWWTPGGSAGGSAAFITSKIGGALEIKTDNAADDSYYEIAHGANFGWLGVTGGMVLRAFVSIPTITHVKVEVGVRDVADGESVSVYFDTDTGDTHWFTYTDDGTDTINTASSVVVAADTMYELMFAASDAGGIDFYINRTFILNHAGASIPESDDMEAFVRVTSRAITTARTVLLFSHYLSNGIAA
jgi:hypothetical protein